MTRQTVEHLTAFSRLYGYVRYFHPSDGAAAMDWERFAVLGAGRMLRLGGRGDLKRELERLCLPIAPTMQLFRGRPRRPEPRERPPGASIRGPLVAWQHVGVTGSYGLTYAYRSVRLNRVTVIEDEAGKRHEFSKPQFRARPRFGEATIKPIGAGLWCRVPLALRSIEGLTWGPPSPWPLRDLHRALGGLPPRRLTAARAEVRAAGVIIVWNVFQHFYPYFDCVRVDWHRVLGDFLGRALRDHSREDYVTTLSLLLERTGDGHAWVKCKPSEPRAWPPLAFAWVQGKLVVAWAAHGAPARRGDVVLRIDGEPARRRLRRIAALIPGSPQHKRRQAVAGWREVMGGWWGRQGSGMRLRLKRGTRVFDAVVHRTRRWEPREPRKHKPIERLADGVWYVDLSRATWRRIDRILPALSRGRGTVFDLRGYPREWRVTWSLLEHLLRTRKTSQRWYAVPRRIYPDREREAGFDLTGWRLRPRRPRPGGRLVLLTDAAAISQAECIVAFVARHRLATIVGEPTAGVNGDVEGIRLPGGFLVHWTGARVVKHDGSRFHGLGFRPDVPTARTLRGVAEGRDECVEHALRLIEGRRRGS